MASKRQKQAPEAGAGMDPNAWMATFSDLLTLMLTFFVLLLSMSSMDNRALKDTFGFFKDKMGLLKQSASAETTQGSTRPVTAFLNRKVFTELEGLELQDAGQTARMAMKIERMIDENNLEHLLQARQVPGGISISIANESWFNPDSTLKSSSHAVLDSIADLLNMHPRLHLKVAGIQGVAEPGLDPWRQATSRGLTVLSYLLSRGRVDAHQLAIAGYGPGWKRPGLVDVPNKLELTLVAYNKPLRPSSGAKE